MSNTKASTSRSFLLLSTITIVEKMIGFVYQASIASIIGANLITDCYFSTFELLSLIDYSLVAALTVALLKRYSDIVIQSDRDAGALFLSRMRSISVPIIATVSLALLFFARPISIILAPTYDSIAREMLVKNIRYMSAVPTVLAICSYYLVILRQQKRFLIVGSKSLFINIVGFCALAIYWIIRPNDALILCVGYNIALLLYTFVAFAATRNRVRLSFVLPTIDREFSCVLTMVFPLAMSNGMMRISSMVDRVIASGVGVGSVTCLTYSQMLFNVVDSMFIVNISTVLLSDFSDLVAHGEFIRMQEKVRRAVISMVLLLIPITIVSVFCSFDIAKIVFGRGQFADSDVHRVSTLLLVYALGFVPSVISNIYTQVHYSYGETKRALFISLFSIVCNIIISLFSVRRFGLIGLAIGTTASFVISAYSYYVSASELMKARGCVLDSKVLFPLVLASLCCLVVNHVVHLAVGGRYFLSFLLSTFLGGAAYFGVLVLMKESTVCAYLRLVQKRASRLVSSSRRD